MKKFISIRTKLVFYIMILISVIFAILLSVITITNVIALNKNIERSKKNIRNSLMAKGKMLARNNSMAMSGMAADNAFTAIQGLVSSTVSDDEDLEYGIYMDLQRVPWVYASKADPKGIPNNNAPLNDSLSFWADTLKELAFKEYCDGKMNIIEFASPVSDNDNILGYIRYGISTRSMEKAIKEVLAAGRTARNQSIFIILLMGLFSLIIGYIIVRQVAVRIAQPIGSLVNSSKIIAEGHYDVSVNPESNDEIGNLAGHFEAMRVTIKKYTDHLQGLIDEKMQQVNDILNNIDQGLFTINLDGTVNKEYSARANKILKVDDVASCSLKDLLRFNTKQETAFSTWLELVQKKHSHQRWTKLARLAPIQEIELFAQSDTNAVEYISISYQRIYNKTGELAKIMILAIDKTEKRLKDIQMAAERLHHENDVKAILSIANTPVEEIAEFMEDTSARLRALRAEATDHLAGVKRQRETHPNGPPYLITKEHVDRLYRNLHTIKGNSGSYEFEILSHYAHEAEDRLEKLREPIEERRDTTISEIIELLGKMDRSIADLHEKIKLIFGKEEEITVRIPEARVNSIVDLSKRLRSDTRDPQAKELITECIMLSWKPLKTILRKYQKLAMKIARRFHKNINFIINNDTTLYPQDVLIDLDDVLIHLIRNSVVHGIEEIEVREELGKGIGRIQISFSCSVNKRIITIVDDGRGIDFEQIVEKSIEKKLLSREEASRLSQEEITGLLFKGGVSTSASITDISGRGMGMQIIHDTVTDLKGTLSIDSKLGKGTTFIITIPVNKEPSFAIT